MKTKMILFALCVGILGSSFTLPKKPKAATNEHILIYGELSELGNTEEDILRILDNHRVFVYQEEELYVVFESDANGEFKFNLPTGHKYELVFGDKLFVNKIVEIDATHCAPKKNGHLLAMDMGLFTPMDGVSYTFMEDPIAKLNFDENEGSFEVDRKHSSVMSKKMKKIWAEMKDRPAQEYNWIR